MSISKSASIMYRMGQVYFDEQLLQYQIGSGQQFILLRMSEYESVFQNELCLMSNYDKGTVARAISKLVEQNYVERKVDENDHRMVKLKVSDKGKKLIPIIKVTIADWHNILMQGLTKSEQQECTSLMEKLSFNALNYLKTKKREGKG